VETERRSADTESDLQATVADLKKPTARLEALRGRIPNTLLDQTRDALVQGDRSRADKCFAQIEAWTEAAIRAAAEAAYQRSRIALDEIRYRSAYAHAQRAARLAPENSLYLTGTGELARMLGHYGTARDYFEQALASDLDTYGEDHPEVAIRRNSLGVIWLKLGEPRQALGYLESALASDLDTYGEDHPTVAIRRNNLGAAWQALGEYPKAIGCFEQALPVLEHELGPEHPAVKKARARLTAARAG